MSIHKTIQNFLKKRKKSPLPKKMPVVKIRSAKVPDFKKLYALGKSTPEFKVSATGEFMTPGEFLAAIKNPRIILLLAEINNKQVGFIYASRQDIARGPEKQWACLSYLVVKPAYRKLGVAQVLYMACIKVLKRHGINHVYSWANAESDGSIINFFKKQGFEKGHTYIWMDKKI